MGSLIIPSPLRTNVYGQTVSAITSFILAMLTNPEVQRKAQVEIDKVVGTARLPTFDDREELVYLDSVLKEVHRWNPVANLGALAL